MKNYLERAMKMALILFIAFCAVAFLGSRGVRIVDLPWLFDPLECKHNLEEHAAILNGKALETWLSENKIEVSREMPKLEDQVGYLISWAPEKVCSDIRLGLSVRLKEPASLKGIEFRLSYVGRQNSLAPQSVVFGRLGEISSESTKGENISFDSVH